jgi:signal transduction histidine kinase
MDVAVARARALAHNYYRLPAEMTPLELHEQVAMLAARIVDGRARIIERWRKAVQRDSRVQASDSLSRAQFVDHIPAVLQAMHDAIVARTPESEARPGELAQGHGSHRWQQGYALLEVIREWSHLQIAVLAEIQRAAEEQPGFDLRALNAAHQAVARLCLEAMSSSVEEFERLQRAEAKGQLMDLGRSLDALDEFEQRQAELLRGVAHDLRGHMGIVSTATAALGMAELPPDRRAELFATAQRAVQGQSLLIADLMDLARLQAGLERRTVAQFDAARTLFELCSTMHPMAAARQLYLRCDGATPLIVESDAAKVARIVQNLVLNALHYTTSGGVTVHWGDSAPDDPGRWRIHVADTGPGIDAGGPLADAIQEATEQARQGGDTTAVQVPPSVRGARGTPVAAPVRHGEGIGLSIVKRLCELLDATLALDSAPGRGTSFTILLPRRYPSEPAV